MSQLPPAPAAPGSMSTLAVVLENPEQLALQSVELIPPTAADVIVDVHWSGISTGTERLLYTGRMPDFPGMGYPLIPGYESVGVVRHAGAQSGRAVGQFVFVAGARCYAKVRGLFGGAAACLIVPGSKAIPVAASLGENAILFALAATAYHAIAAPGALAPELIVGHGVLGRLLARITIALGHAAPVVWEKNPERGGDELGYHVMSAEHDTRTDYHAVYDVSGDCQILDLLMRRLAPGGEIVLAGFYTEALSFNFAPAFMREARMRVAAEWRPDDLTAVKALVDSGSLSLERLITHQCRAQDAKTAYKTAFNDASCLKMVLDWRDPH